MLFDKPADQSAPRDIASLHGARGVAALIVFVSHAANLGLLPAVFGKGMGQMGVHLFFVLSGFLMGYLYIDRPLTAFEVRSYALARIGRVVPLYVAAVLLSWCLWREGSPFIHVESLAAHLAFLHGGNVFWTIPVEMQFYVLLVFLWWVWASSNSADRGGALMLACGVIAISSAALVLFFRRLDVGDRYLPFYVLLFLTGTVCGVLYHRHWRTFQSICDRYAHLTATIAITLSIIAIPELRRSIGLPLLTSWMDPLMTGSMVIFFLAALGSVSVFKILRTEPLKWLGGISYGMYLLHLPILTAVAMLGPEALGGKVVCLALALGITLLLSHLSARYFERPMQRFIQALGRSKTVPQPAVST